MEWFIENAQFSGIYLAGFFLVYFVGYLAWKTISRGVNLQKLLDLANEESHIKRDPWRVFKFSPRKRILKRAGQRCEWNSSTNGRCKVRGDLTIDHIYPWAAGGWTIEPNAQVLCTGHAMVKGGLIPEKRAMKEIERRRQGYFPENMETEVRWLPTPEEKMLHHGIVSDSGAEK